jgi:hypothetical protein
MFPAAKPPLSNPTQIIQWLYGYEALLAEALSAGLVWLWLAFGLPSKLPCRSACCPQPCAPTASRRRRPTIFSRLAALKAALQKKLL